ncbi:MAG: RlmE family RNA methyltransferase [Bdellovibrionales bacterium]|nr:RlmE family RNA methyltransferase [Bdellovibrionales bacterium]
MAFNPQDHYFKKAKKEGFLARSAYKLDEIQKKYRVIKPHDKVLDLGCAPGAWSQIILKIMGKSGFLRGVDLTAVTLRAPNAEFIQKDIFEMAIEEFKEAPYDCIVSDMAPKTSGVVFRDQVLSEELCQKVIELSDVLLKPGGHLVMKLFQGGGTKEIQTQVQKRFSKHQMLKPSSTRKESKEIFLIGLKKKG